MMIRRAFLSLARPIAEPSALECIAFAVVGAILARALGLGDSLLGGASVFRLPLCTFLDCSGSRSTRPRAEGGNGNQCLDN